MTDPRTDGTPARALVVFSGGQDSTTCLLLALRDFGPGNVKTITFSYGQRHRRELDCARDIADALGVTQHLVDASVIAVSGRNALTDSAVPISHTPDAPYPNTFVAGRNALFLLLAAGYAHAQGIHDIYTGVCETDYSGYPDCRDVFVKAMNVSLNLAMDYPFRIHTPLMFLDKAQVWALADQLGALEFVRDRTHSCYQGSTGGCGQCPSCRLREAGLQRYLRGKNREMRS